MEKAMNFSDWMNSSSEMNSFPTYFPMTSSSFPIATNSSFLGMNSSFPTTRNSSFPGMNSSSYVMNSLPTSLPFPGMNASFPTTRDSSSYVMNSLPTSLPFPFPGMNSSFFGMNSSSPATTESSFPTKNMVILCVFSAAVVLGSVVYALRPPSKSKSRIVTRRCLGNGFDEVSRNRANFLSRDDYYMSIAFLSADLSEDPYNQSGACLVNQNGIILGTGCNGVPSGCSDHTLALSGNPFYSCHAEFNAIMNINHASAAGHTLYVTRFPCNECVKMIIQSGVSEVVYSKEKSLNTTDPAYVASCSLLLSTRVLVRRHRPHPQAEQILIYF